MKRCCNTIHSLQEFFPGNGFGKDLPLQPKVIVHLEVFGKVDPLSQHALQTVVHREEFGVGLVLIVASAVEPFDAGT